MTNEEREAIAQLRAAFVHVWRVAGANLRIGAIGSSICALLTVCALCSALGSAVYSHPSSSSSPSASLSRTATAAPSVTLSSSSTATAKPATQPTATATPTQPTAQQVLKISGDGDKNSKTFTVHGTWEIGVTCKVDLIGYGSESVDVYVYNADGSATFGYDFSYDCPDGTKGGHDTTTEHGGGTFYLSVIGAGTIWTITVQDMPD